MKQRQQKRRLQQSSSSTSSRSSKSGEGGRARRWVLCGVRFFIFSPMIITIIITIQYLDKEKVNQKVSSYFETIMIKPSSSTTTTSTSITTSSLASSSSQYLSKPDQPNPKKTNKPRLELNEYADLTGVEYEKLISEGKKVGIVDLTRGELGTRGTPELRAQEAAAASKVMGLHVRENLGFRDGFFKNDETHQLGIIQMIRKYQPDIVITNAPHDRHPDHGRSSNLVREAVFLSGLRKIETTYDQSTQEAWRPKRLFFFIQDYYLEPSFVVDITPFFEKKI